MIEEVISISRKAGEFIKSHFEKVNAHQIETKDQNSLVSFVDKTAEKMLVDGLGALLPNAGFLTEEDTINDLDKEYVWVIDPLDGTTNFLQGLPHFSVSVALQKGKVIILGVVIDVMQGDVYFAERGKGAFRNGERISVSGKTNISQAVIATGFPYSQAARTEQVRKTLNLFLDNVRGIRRLGSAALDMTYVACGKLDGFYETTLNPWDVAAGIILVQEAGGYVANFQGDEKDYSGYEILACNQAIQDPMLKLVKRGFDMK